MADPFLIIDAFEAEYQGTLTAGETTTASRLLQVVSDYIRSLKPDVNTDAAKQVCFEIVRDAANYGDLAVLSDFQNTTSRRTEAGTFDQAMKIVNDYLSDRHRLLLGIPLLAAPVTSFAKFDY